MLILLRLPLTNRPNNVRIWKLPPAVISYLGNDSGQLTPYRQILTNLGQEAILVVSYISFVVNAISSKPHVFLFNTENWCLN